MPCGSSSGFSHGPSSGFSYGSSGPYSASFMSPNCWAAGSCCPNGSIYRSYSDIYNWSGYGPFCGGYPGLGCFGPNGPKPAAYLPVGPFVGASPCSAGPCGYSGPCGAGPCGAGACGGPCGGNPCAVYAACCCERPYVC